MSFSNLPSPAQLRALADWIEQMEGAAPILDSKPIPPKKTETKRPKSGKQLTDREMTALAKAIVRKKFFK